MCLLCLGPSCGSAPLNFLAGFRRGAGEKGEGRGAKSRGRKLRGEEGK